MSLRQAGSRDHVRIRLWESRQLNTPHNEDWYRINVYSSILDGAFLMDDNYDIKRYIGEKR